jgi:hypothetical protein
VSKVPRNPWLIVGGCLSLAAALLHVGVIVGGPDWYRFFGAGEAMARAAEQGRWMPHLVTICIAALLTVWALYAFAGAGLFRRLPLMRIALVLITLIYLARGLLIIPIMMKVSLAEAPFDYWSSLIVLVYGVAYAVGTWRAWPYLKPRREAHALGS